MKILHITREIGSDSKYGIRKSIIPISNAMRENGHQVDIFDGEKASSVRLNFVESWIENICFICLKIRFKKEGRLAWNILKERIFISWRATKYLKNYNYSHIHCHDPLLGYYIHLFSKYYRSNYRWGFTVHSFGRFVKLRLGIKTSNSSLLFLQKKESFAIQRANWIIFPTKSGMQQMMTDANIKHGNSNYHILPHAIQVNKIDFQIARKKIGVDIEETLLIGVGQLIPMKRFDLLLKSIALIPKQSQPRLIILGGGPEKENLYKLANKLGITNFEIRTSDNIGDYLSAANIYVSTSSTESFGMANCEAIKAGVPSVCTKVDAVKELLQGGALLTRDDPAEISTAIQNILNDKSLRNQLKKNSEKLTSEWPSAEEIALEFEKILNDK